MGDLEAWLKTAPTKTDAKTLTKLVAEAANASRRVQGQLAWKLSREVPHGTHLDPAGPYLLGLLALAPEGRGQARTDPARPASRALRQTNAFDVELRALVAAGGVAGVGARRTLVAGAAMAGRWDDIDLLVATKGEGLLAAVEALLEVAEDAAIAPGPNASMLLQRIDELRPNLRKGDLADVEKRLEKCGEKLGITTSATPTLKDLLALLADPKAKTRQAADGELTRLVRADPSLAEQLPDFTRMSDGPIRQTIAHLRFVALRQRGDVAGVRDHFAACRRLGLRIPLSALGNGGAGAGIFADVVLPYLEDEDADVRGWAAYYVAHVTPEAGLELAPFARLILRSTIDGARLYFDTVSTNGRWALRQALAATKNRAAFLEAARAVDAELDAPLRRKFREQLKNYFPDAHVAIVGGVDNASAVVTVDLLAAVHEARADDAPRLVYADKLLESGDPRGEFIILQCERARSGGEPTRRELELLAKHRKRWLGNVASWIGPEPRFERGFLVACSIARKLETIPRPARMNPVWATVEEIDLTNAYRDRSKKQDTFLRTTPLPALRTLLGVELGEIAYVPFHTLVRVGLLVEELEWSRLVAVLSRQPHLAELSLPVAPPPEVQARIRDELTSLRAVVLPDRRLERGRDFTVDVP